MFALLIKYRQPCLWALCALLGLACADLATTLAGMRLSAKALPQSVAPAARRPMPASDPAADLAFILQHHLFDPGSRTATAPALSLNSEDDKAVTGSQTFELVGTIVAGERSLAVLRSGQETGSYRLGEELPGGGTIEEITRHQVTIRNASHALTTLGLPEGGRSVPADVAPPPAAAGATGQVRAAGDNRWVIPRAMAASIRDNLGEQLRLALMQPRIVNGRTDGFIIKKIDAGTLLAQMGLRRGDVLKRVNTMPFDSPEKALQILQQLREARQLNVDLERDGKPLTFAYAIE